MADKEEKNDDFYKRFGNSDLSPEKRLWCTVLLNLMIDILTEKQEIKKIYDNNRLMDFEKDKMVKLHKYSLHLLMRTLNSEHIQDVCSWIDVDHDFYKGLADNDEFLNTSFSSRKMLAACRFDVSN